MYQLFAFLFFAVALVQPASASRWTASEISAMPPYCAGRFARELNNMQEYKRWEAQYGPDFLHTHHLCHGIGLLDIKYPKARTEQERRYILDGALGELGYMLTNAKPDFALMPDVHLYRGIALAHQNKNSDALKSILNALELNPNISIGYGWAADLYVRLGAKDLAMNMVTDGLQRYPNNKRLQRLYLQLGGKPPSPGSTGDNETIAASQHNEATSGVKPATAATSKEESGTHSERNSVVFTFSKGGMGGMKHGYNAGDSVLLEVQPDPKTPDTKVSFRITSLIQETHSRIARIGLDLGKHTNMFSRLEPDGWQGKYYPVTHHPTPYVHPFWPKFNAHYTFQFIIDPKLAKPNDPRKLSPGSSLTITAYLAPGVRYEDVIQALNRGTQHQDGLRMAIIGQHLAGPPLPGGTRSDDGGYFTGKLLRATGPIAKILFSETRPVGTTKENVDAKQPTDTKDKPEEVATMRVNTTDVSAKPVESSPAPKPNPRNPWCRFCPTEQ